MSAAKVLALFGQVDRKSSLLAISNAIYAIEYKERLTMAQIGAEIDVDGDTVENAKYQRNLMNFVAISRLLGKWPEHCQEIRNLWEMQVSEPLTPCQRIERAQREIDAALSELEGRA